MNQNTSRRTFLKSASLTAAAVAGAPMILRADDKASDRPVILGEGAHQYECIHGWAQLPSGMKFGNTHMVQEDAQGRILIHHQGGSGQSVCVFDPDGKFIKAWGKEWAAGAHGMQLRKEGNEEFLYLTPTGQGRIVKTNLDGEVVFNNGFPNDAKNAKGEPCYPPDGKGFVPTNVAFAPNGEFYVADGYGKHYIHQYDIKGNYIRTFGGSGAKDGELRTPHGIWVDTRDASNPRVLVADRSNERLQYFSLDGKHLQTIKGEFRHPCHFDQRGTEVLLPGLHGRVSILDANNNVIAKLGDNTNDKQRGRNNVGPDQRQPGVFVSPHGASFDRAGNIYVTEWVADGRVIKLRKLA